MGTDPRIRLAAWRASNAPTHKSRVFSTSPGCVGRLRRTWFLAGSLVASILAGCWSQFRCLRLYWRSTNHGHLAREDRLGRNLRLLLLLQAYPQNASLSSGRVRMVHHQGNPRGAIVPLSTRKSRRVLSGPIGRDRSHAAGCDLVSRGRVCVFPCQSSALHHYRGMLLSTLRNRGASSARSGIEGAKSSSLSFGRGARVQLPAAGRSAARVGREPGLAAETRIPDVTMFTGPAACGELHFSRCSQGVALGALAAAGRRRWRSPLSLSPHRSCFWAM